MNDYGMFKLTEEQAKAINNSDIDSMTKFYFDNLAFLKNIAYKYTRKYNCYYCDSSFVEDMLQSIYVDLPSFCFDNWQTIYYSILKTFQMTPLGGSVVAEELDCHSRHYQWYEYLKSYPTVVVDSNGDDYCLLDKAVSVPSCEAEEIEKEKSLDLQNSIISLSSLFNKRNNIFIKAIIDGYTFVNALRLAGDPNYKRANLSSFRKTIACNYEIIASTLCGKGLYQFDNFFSNKNNLQKLEQKRLKYISYNKKLKELRAL